ncbi:MAG TPA: hypothetical protein VHG89_10270 [Verrucomicrobiae bacterium]|nr:hypothetical protein [Verrucomicrobiae bacterium]
MKQHEAVIKTLGELGGVATLGQLYKDVFKIADCEWKTKTPLASIRRIVQTRKEIFKIKPGLYGLTAKKNELESQGIIAETQKNQNSAEVQKFGHTYYQGLLLIVGKLKKFDCWSPNQDKNKKFLNSNLDSLRTLKEIPKFSYEHLVSRSATIDAIWFNERGMPNSFFEVEASTDIQNSLLKFNDLQDFASRMFIVSNPARRKEFEAKLKYSSFRDIAKRVDFLTYDSLVEQYERTVAFNKTEMIL